MGVPDFQSLMRPLLVALEDGQDHSIKAIRASLAAGFSLSQADIDERTPSGRVTTFQNRVGWATTYLYRTNLIDRPKRAVYRITGRGRQVLEQNPERVDLKVLSQFEGFAQLRQTKTTSAGGEAPVSIGGEEETPDARIVAAYREVHLALAAEVLDRVVAQSPEFFEQLVLDVLHAMEYGGGQDNPTERLGQSGDGGVDGVIREDRLGLDLIYVQAKRWQHVVGRPEIQKFFGALHGKRATKGVFITTSSFSREAREYADGVTPRVILVEGKELAQLMIQHKVGVSVARTYELKRLDLTYFETDEDEYASVEPDPPGTREEAETAA